ncbi:hypothetical protein HPP92_017921 [Vanilla planifolia]|uniref:Uncharacterized protein n=1 Tax=Vanilla planifolia TaxID=51239 RepID=A0A835UP15_VANPL|nr:hypothetical protein HPP92_017921 [Vanilla planifolia]
MAAVASESAEVSSSTAGRRFSSSSRGPRGFALLAFDLPRPPPPTFPTVEEARFVPAIKAVRNRRSPAVEYK